MNLKNALKRLLLFRFDNIIIVNIVCLSVSPIQISVPNIYEKLKPILFAGFTGILKVDFGNGRMHSMLTKEMRKVLDKIISARGTDKSNLIAIMQDVQKEYRYLPEECISYISEKLGISDAKAYGVATFYENFSLEPKGKYVIKVCDGTACHVRKSIPILEELRNQLGLSAEKHTTDDMLFTVETVSCLGACGLAPVCTVNDAVHPAMTPEKVRTLVAELKEAEGI